MLAEHGFDARVVDQHVNGSGLTALIVGLDPLAYVLSKIDAYPATDIAVFEWAGACETPCPLTYGSQEWLDAWEAEARAIVEAVRARDITVVWVASPPPPPGGTSGPPYTYWDDDSLHVGVALAHALADGQDVVLADWYRALAAQDDFLGHDERTLVFDGAEHTVRVDDDIHLSQPGALRAAVWTAAALADAWPTASTIPTRPT